MKAFLAIALTVAAGMASLWLWGAGHAGRMAASSSQIFIHGTPVCVTQRGGQIEAAVGECAGRSMVPRGENDGFHGAHPGPANPNAGLPPGHPPIGDVPAQEFGERGRTLI
jgi:hypothetical protein